MGKNNLLCGVGINDANYKVQIRETVGHSAEGERIRKLIWRCPYYAKWVDMMMRCYSKKYQQKQPTYLGCSVTPEWHYFMTFRAWMEKQDWEGKCLDKDILFPSNKIYSPEACVFVSYAVNNFLLERQNHRGDWPIGVNFHKETGKFRARCNSIVTGKPESLGLFETPLEAHKAWLAFKLKQAKILASKQTDERVAKALIERYENYVNS